MRIALIGMPGSGKTTLGKALAQRLDSVFIDLDQQIESRLECSIRLFFEHKGEAAFREIETQTLEQLTQPAPMTPSDQPTMPGTEILATGGGCVLHARNRAVLRERCYVIYLDTPLDLLIRRLRQDKVRPLLAVDDPVERLRSLYETRDPLYRGLAHHIVRNDAGLTSRVLRQLVEEISRQF
jgi:shikimate kinase